MIQWVYKYFVKLVLQKEFLGVPKSEEPEFTMT